MSWNFRLTASETKKFFRLTRFWQRTSLEHHFRLLWKKSSSDTSTAVGLRETFAELRFRCSAELVAGSYCSSAGSDCRERPPPRRRRRRGCVMWHDPMLISPSMTFLCFVERSTAFEKGRTLSASQTLWEYPRSETPFRQPSCSHASQMHQPNLWTHHGHHLQQTSHCDHTPQIFVFATTQNL